MADMNKAGTPKQAPIVPGFTPKQYVGVGGEILSAEPRSVYSKDCCPQYG